MQYIRELSICNTCGQSLSGSGTHGAHDGHIIDSHKTMFLNIQYKHNIHPETYKKDNDQIFFLNVVNENTLGCSRCKNKCNLYDIT